MKKAVHHLKRHHHRVYDKSMYPENDLPAASPPVAQFAEGNNRRFPPAAFAAIALLLFSGIVFATYLITQGGTGNTPPTQLPSLSEKPSQIEQTKGKVAAFKEDLLTLTLEDGQQTTMRVVFGAAILKQKRINPYTSTSVPAKLNLGNTVSVQSTQNPGGEQEANLILILDDTATKSATIK